MVGVGAVPSRELLLLSRSQHGQAGKFLFGVGDDRFQHRLEMPRHAFHGGGIKQVGAVHKAAEQALGTVIEFQIKIELGGADFDIKLVQVPSGLESRSRWNQREHHWKQRIPAGVAAHREFFDEPLKRSVVMGERSQRDFPRMRQQIAEAGISIQFQTQC